MIYPKVSIIMLNWNGLKDTIECLDSLKRVTYPNYEIILIDNGSRGNDAQELSDKFDGYISLIENDKNYGYPVGMNIGIRHALNTSNPDYLLLLNNDTVVDPEFLTEMVSVTEIKATSGLAGAKIYDYYYPDQLTCAWVRINLWIGQWFNIPIGVRMAKVAGWQIDRGQYDAIKEIDGVSGCCLLIKRQTLEDIGMLDEKYVFSWEDIDYYIRASRAGYKVVYVPRARIWHKGAQSSKKVAGFSMYYVTRNAFRFMKKNASRWQYLCFLIYLFGCYLWLMTLICSISYRSLGALIGFYRGIRDGLFDIRAIPEAYELH